MSKNTMTTFVQGLKVTPVKARPVAMRDVSVALATHNEINWLVAKVEGLLDLQFAFPTGAKTRFVVLDERGRPFSMLDGKPYTPCTHWDHGGKLIDKYDILIDRRRNKGIRAFQRDAKGLICNSMDCRGDEETKLMTAMRCLVLSRTGEIAKVPKSLKGNP